MLMQRVLTALVLLPLLIALVWFAPTQVLYGVLSAVGILMAWEWCGLMRLPRRALARRGFLLATALLLAGVWMSPVNGPWLSYALAPIAVLWLLMPLQLRRFPASGEPPRAVMAIGGLLMIASTLIAIAALHAQTGGALKLLFVLVLVFAADTGAYFAGRTFGKRKLAPQISPGKTIEGALGGLALAGAWAALVGPQVFAIAGAVPMLKFLLLAMLVAVVSIIGDLTESMLKRAVGLKDSGSLLPGHGGVLDRVDSIVAAVPVMVVGLHLAGIH